MTFRVATYLRVSTTRQAESDLSIPDQRTRLQQHCDTKGWTVVAEYVEPGASATEDRRPQFLQMIEDACRSDTPFDAILVHSYSRFFRDAVEMELYIRKLAKKNVRLISVTQEHGDDPTGELIRRIVSLFDEYQSRENAKHTTRAMVENARQGFWNGSTPPLGYRAVAAEQRGQKTKKKLEIEPAEAAIVQKIFKLYLYGNGKSGPLGIKAVVEDINAAGHRQRNGNSFYQKNVHQILTRTTYSGRHYFNRVHSKTGKAKPRDEWVELMTPVIIDQQTFDEVQARLKRNRPDVTPPRVTSGPTLLTGLLRCGYCNDSGMTIRTGKGGRYRYYSCAKKIRQSRHACSCPNLPMAELDVLITQALAEQVFAGDRMVELLDQLLEKQAETQIGTKKELQQLKSALSKADAGIGRMFDALENGVVTADEMFRERIQALKARREETLHLIAKAERRISLPGTSLTPEKIGAIGRKLRERLLTGDPKLRRAYLQLFVSQIVVTEGEARVCGPVSSLEKVAEGQKSDLEGLVPTSEREWRPLGESNPCFRRERDKTRLLANSPELRQTININKLSRLWPCSFADVLLQGFRTFSVRNESRPRWLARSATPRSIPGPRAPA